MYFLCPFLEKGDIKLCRERNFPMAFFWQTFIAGPLVRNAFKIFESGNNVESEEKQAAQKIMKIYKT